MSVPFPERWVVLKSLLDADRPPLDPGLYFRPRRSCTDDVAAELLGYPSSAFGVQEPRAGWLSLVVTSLELDEERCVFGPVVGRLQSLLPP